jgi:hypothetical protein
MSIFSKGFVPKSVIENDPKKRRKEKPWKFIY